MDVENGRLRERAYTKAKKKPMRDSSHARHMTSEQNIAAMAKAEWKSKMKEVHREASGKFKTQKARIAEFYK